MSELAYEVRGSGPPCIVLPGGPGLDATYLKSELFDRRFTTVYLDPLGTGASGRLALPEQYSRKRDVAMLEGLRVALGLDKLCLLGHSAGGFIAQQYALDHPDHVRALILYSSSPTTGEDFTRQRLANLEWFKAKPWWPDACASDAAEAKATNDDELNAAFAPRFPVYFADWDSRPGDFKAALAGARISYERAKNRDDDGPFEVRARLDEIEVPTLIITGEKDFICGVVPSTWLARGITGAKLVVIPNAGHFSHIEKPDDFARALDEFMPNVR